MKAPAIVVSTLMTAALVSTPASAHTMPIERAVSHMVDQLVSNTTYELKLEVTEAVANAVYLFEPESSATRKGAVSVTELTASENPDREEDQDMQMQ